MYTPNKSSSRRVEVRSPDSACNPYLTFAVLLAAGSRASPRGYELPEEAGTTCWALTPGERQPWVTAELPGSLAEALHVMESSRTGRRNAR